MNRDDLRRLTVNYGPHLLIAPYHLIRVTDADLASLGYVKLDGIDVDEIRGDLNHYVIGGHSRRALEQIIAALDREDTDG